MRRRAWNSTLPAPSQPLPKVNRERQQRRDSEGLVYGPHHAYARRLLCALRGQAGHACTGRVEGHHVVSVGAGGVDADNVAPLCEGGHRLDQTSVHVMGANSFAAYWMIDLQQIASDIWKASPYNPQSKLAREFDAEVEAQRMACAKGIHPLAGRVIRGGRVCCPCCREAIR